MVLMWSQNKYADVTKPLWFESFNQKLKQNKMESAKKYFGQILQEPRGFQIVYTDFILRYVV